MITFSFFFKLQTVDAAINSGNSGGPALSGSKVVGVAFQSYAGDADNIGKHNDLYPFITRAKIGWQCYFALLASTKA